MMSAVRGRDTKIELLLRSMLHRRGFRFRTDARNLPGRPDIVFPKYRAVIFLHGCFWHGHDCRLFRWPRSNQVFWKDKIGGNQARDARNLARLLEAGWRILSVWECSIRGQPDAKVAEVVDTVDSWLRSESRTDEIRGPVT